MHEKRINMHIYRNYSIKYAYKCNYFLQKCIKIKKVVDIYIKSGMITKDTAFLKEKLS